MTADVSPPAQWWFTKGTRRHGYQVLILKLAYYKETNITGLLKTKPGSILFVSSVFLWRRYEAVFGDWYTVNPNLWADSGVPYIICRKKACSQFFNSLDTFVTMLYLWNYFQAHPGGEDVDKVRKLLVAQTKTRTWRWEGPVSTMQHVDTLWVNKNLILQSGLGHEPRVMLLQSQASDNTYKEAASTWEPGALIVRYCRGTKQTH